jgi:predicted nucleic acid-binding protein
MRAVLADSGPLYALVDPDDGHHQRARHELAAIQGEGRSVVLAWPILLECYSLVLHRLGTSAAHRWLAEVQRGVGRVAPLTEELDAACERVRRYPDQTVSLFDTVLHELAVRLSISIWSFDHHFDLLGADVWRR